MKLGNVFKFFHENLLGILLVSIAGGLIASFLYTHLTSNEHLNNMASQEGVIDIPQTGEFKVSYPVHFLFIPHLAINRPSPYNLHTFDYKILEQRSDGFNILITQTNFPTKLEWKAKGVVESRRSRFSSPIPRKSIKILK